MSRESYARGFCKAAAAAGVDPVALAKYAQESMGAMKAAQANAQQTADGALIKREMKPVNDRLRMSPKGTTVKFSPNLQKLVLAYQQKYGKDALQKLLGRANA